MVLLYLIFLMSFLTPQTRTSVCVWCRGGWRPWARTWRDHGESWPRGGGRPHDGPGCGSGRGAKLGMRTATSYDGAWRGVAGRAAAMRDLAVTMVHVAAVVHVTWRRRCMRPAVEGEEYKVGWWGPLVTCEAPTSSQMTVLKFYPSYLSYYSN
jgi:hypothetical protein